jgi:hypothetical protein
VIQQDGATSISVALLAAIALSAATTAAARMIWRRARALLLAAEQARCLPGSGELAIMEDDAVAEAFAVPGRPGRIVVSTGMLTALDPPQREALLAHERAHLRSHPLARAVAFTIERWADEEAATACADRHMVARTIAKAALTKAALAKATTARRAAAAPGKAVGLFWRSPAPPPTSPICPALGRCRAESRLCCRRRRSGDCS